MTHMTTLVRQRRQRLSAFICAAETSEVRFFRAIRKRFGDLHANSNHSAVCARAVVTIETCVSVERFSGACCKISYLMPTWSDRHNVKNATKSNAHPGEKEEA